jgi:anti-sigma factor RsiW
MNCALGTRNDAELLAYSSRKLDPSRVAALEKHLAGCPACREFVAQQRAVWDALDTWEPEPVSADFNRRLYRRIENQARWWDGLLQPLRPLILNRPLPLAAAAAVLLFTAVMLERPAAPPKAPAHSGADLVAVESLQPDQLVKALDEMEELSKFNRLMKSETPESKM